MSATIRKIDRRDFLKTGVTAAGGLMLGLFPAGQAAGQGGARGGRGGAGAAVPPSAFIHIGADDVVTLIVHKPENGQGTETSIAMLLAEELHCDWSRVRTEFAPINPTFYGGATQGTFGSQAIRTSWTPMRRAGAAARDMLLQAAAARWGVDQSQCRAENGMVIHTST
ncbi:MAG TPA: molybdopterin cofactor-binding domain-containing protein, partial [Terriglobia bacterium]|nr:molybdopterin cofactor-binding domain-containing protein [Terriglobia bacterium]